MGEELYRSPGPSEALIRRWDDEVAAYDTRSGDTHLLTAVAGDVVTRLQQAPASVADITAHVAISLGEKPDTGFQRDVNRLLVSLRQIGLIELTET